MQTSFKTVMANQLVDELDECFSPIDGIVAIDQIFHELPLLHRPAKFRLFDSRRPQKFYYGRYDWYPLGFRYLQIGDELHIQNLFDVAESRLLRHRRFNVVLGVEDGEFNRTYRPFTHRSDDHE